MQVDFFDWGGQLITADQLDPVVQSVYQACLDNSSCVVLELKSNSDNNTQSIIAEFADGTFDVDNQAGIHRMERLSITYTPDKDFIWEVRALRKDFPVTIHQNHVLENEPRSLCLYIEPWSSVERSWTPELFIKRVFWWLRETANGRIHDKDQPIEQIFFSSPYSVVLPNNYFSDKVVKQNCLSFTMVESNNLTTLIGSYADKNISNKPSCVTVPVVLEPVENGPVEEYPYTLGQLQTLLKKKGRGVVEQLKSAILAQVTEDGVSVNNQVKEFILLLIAVPRIRNNVVEKVEIQGFMVDLPYAMLGEKLSVLFKAPKQNKWYRDVLGTSDGDEWENIPIFPISVYSYPTPEDIRQYSGISRDDLGPNGIIAGVGALGGMIAKIWGRECWGEWTYIDDDILKPHNITRHITSRNNVGFPKSMVVDSIVANIHELDSHNSTKHLVGSVVSDAPQVVSRVEESELLVDTTTTLYVPREISKRDSFPRTANVFITPSGMSAVLLLEDKERSIRCNSLEAQYYRAILNSGWGARHLTGHLGKFWVGAGCREATAAISDELIHLHAAILSRQIRKSVSNSSAKICIWEYQDDLSGVTPYDIAVFPAKSTVISGWEVSWDDGFLSETKMFRDEALPNETGGVLFGIVDQKAKTITLVKACSAPEKSDSTPTSFKRGEYQSNELLNNSLERTGGVVTYVGEWHSHPRGLSPQQSQADIHQLSFLNTALKEDGLPALMLIVSDMSFAFYIDGKGSEIDFE